MKLSISDVAFFLVLCATVKGVPISPPHPALQGNALNTFTPPGPSTFDPCFTGEFGPFCPAAGSPPMPKSAEEWAKYADEFEQKTSKDGSLPALFPDPEQFKAAFEQFENPEQSKKVQEQTERLKKVAEKIKKFRAGVKDKHDAGEDAKRLVVAMEKSMQTLKSKGSVDELAKSSPELEHLEDTVAQLHAVLQGKHIEIARSPFDAVGGLKEIIGSIDNAQEHTKEQNTGDISSADLEKRDDGDDIVEILAQINSPIDLVTDFMDIFSDGWEKL